MWVQSMFVQFDSRFNANDLQVTLVMLPYLKVLCSVHVNISIIEIQKDTEVVFLNAPLFILIRIILGYVK